MRIVLCRLGIHRWKLIEFHFDWRVEGGWFERQCRVCGKLSPYTNRRRGA